MTGVVLVTDLIICHLAGLQLTLWLVQFGRFRRHGTVGLREFKPGRGGDMACVRGSCGAFPGRHRKRYIQNGCLDSLFFAFSAHLQYNWNVH